MFSNSNLTIVILGGNGRLGQSIYKFFLETTYDISLLNIDQLDDFFNNLLVSGRQTIFFINCLGDHRSPNSFYTSNFYLPCLIYSRLNTVSSRHSLFFYHISSVGSLSPYSSFDLNPSHFNHSSRNQIFNLYELSKRCADTSLYLMHSLSPSVSVTVLQPSVLVFDSSFRNSKLFFFVKLLFLLFPFSLKNHVSPPITHVSSITEYICNDLNSLSSFSLSTNSFIEVSLYSRFSITSFPFLNLLDSFKLCLSPKFSTQLKSFFKKLPVNNSLSRFLVLVFVL